MTFLNRGHIILIFVAFLGILKPSTAFIRNNYDIITYTKNASMNITQVFFFDIFLMIYYLYIYMCL